MKTILLLLLLFSLSAYSVVVPQCIKILGHKLGEDTSLEGINKREKELVKALQQEPAKLYIELRRQAQTSTKDGDFPYPVYEATMRLILSDLSQRMTEDIAEEDKKLIQSLIDRAHRLLGTSIPYKESMRFTFDYTQALDQIFLKTHPELAGEFHKNHAEHVLEKMLDRAPDVLLLPSYQSVGFKFFNTSRSAPIHVIGLNTTGLRLNEPVPFADGFDMKPSEFAWHDMGHIEFMAGKDFQYSDNTFKPIERVVQEWDFTRKRVEEFHKTLKPNKNLYDAVTMLLFEILHERGYQYSLSVLKTQLDTPKWTEILKRKLDNGYYKRFHWVNMNLFSELEQARQKLLDFVSSARIQDQKNHIAALYGEELAVRVTHFPKVDYAKGDLKNIEITSGKITVNAATTNEKSYQPEIDNLILAQVSPTRNSPFNEHSMKQVNSIVRMMEAKYPVTIDDKIQMISRIIITPEKKILIVLENNAQIPLEAVSIPTHFKQGEPKIIDRQFFEMNQVLGAEEKKQALSFTLHQPTAVYLGTVKAKKENGKERLTITTDDGSHEIPLDEALIDPLQKQDFQRIKF